MRYLICFGLFISFTAAAACPDLTGEYYCKRGSNITYRAIEKTENGFIISQNGNTTEYIADGVTVQTIPSTDGSAEGTFTSYCKNNQFIVDLKADIFYEGSVIAKQVSKTTYELINGNGLNITTKIKMKGIPLPTLKEVCVPK